MKKFSVLILVLSVLLTLVSCGEGPAGQADSSPVGQEKVEEKGEGRGSATRSETTTAP